MFKLTYLRHEQIVTFHPRTKKKSMDQVKNHRDLQPH